MDSCRRIRNRFAHENLEGEIPEEMPENGQQVTLVELIDTVGQVLELAEKVYEKGKS